MCNWFKKKLQLTHPEEPPDYAITMENYDLNAVLDEWLINYRVPLDYWQHWKEQIVITVSQSITSPACTWTENGKRHLMIRPEWLNPGVIAHEQAHNSFFLLTPTDAANFIVDIEELRKTDKLLDFVLKERWFAIHGDYIEAHAEIYRFIDMPKELRKYYPRLFI